jgi:hypothetical protein
MDHGAVLVHAGLMAAQIGALTTGLYGAPKHTTVA